MRCSSFPWYYQRLCMEDILNDHSVITAKKNPTKNHLEIQRPLNVSSRSIVLVIWVGYRIKCNCTRSFICLLLCSTEETDLKWSFVSSMGIRLSKIQAVNQIRIPNLSNLLAKIWIMMGVQSRSLVQCTPWRYMEEHKHSETCLGGELAPSPFGSITREEGNHVPIVQEVG
jgi:hypothetical protein